MLKRSNFLTLIVLITGLLPAITVQARDRIIVVKEKPRPRHITVIQKERAGTFSQGFFSGMLVERILQTHPVIALTAATTITLACIYALLAALPQPTVEHTVIYVEEDEDDEVVYVIRSE